MSYKLRGYQEDAIDIGVDGLHVSKHPFVIQAATGAGKSLIIAGICHRIDQPILILQPSKEILEQNYAKLKSYDATLDLGIYSASMGEKNIAKFTFAMIGSIYKKPEQFKHFKFAIIDECHQLNPKKDDGMLTSFFKKTGIEHVLGLTATPYRLDVIWKRSEWGGLTSTASLRMINRISRTPFFRSINYRIETQELIEQKYLSPIQYFQEPADWRRLKVNSTGAGFTVESEDKWAHRRVDRIVQAMEYLDTHCKRSLIFCSNISQAVEAQERLRDEFGIRAELVTGSTPKKQREALIASYVAGEFKHMLNVGVFTTGFDVPVLDAVVLAKPTMSLALYYQMVGRGVRLDPDDPTKVLKVYDLAGVVARLGKVETIRVQKEANGFRDEVWSEVGRMDGYPLYEFTVPPSEKQKNVI